MNEGFFNLGVWIFSFVCGLAIVETCLAEDQTASGLVAHWEFEEGGGDTVKDSSGNGNDGTIVPANTREPKWGIGNFAGSVSFSGGNDHFIRVPPSASLNNLKRQITVVAFIYPRSLWTPDPCPSCYLSIVQRKWRKAVNLIDKLFGTATDPPTGYIAIVQRQWRETIHPDQYYLGYGLENNILHYKWHLGLMDDDVSLYRLPKGQDKPPVGQWVHLAGTYNGETGKMSLYVDGELIGTQTHAGEIRLDTESLNRPLAIGGELNGPSINEPTAEFDGYVRDIRVYDRALSDEEVKNLAEEAMRQIKGVEP